MTQAEWLAEAQSWVGTPFRWQGRVKGDGVDCWGLVICTAWACGYVPESWDVRSYSRRTDLVALSYEHLPQWFARGDVADCQAGDVVTFHHGSGIMHMGILYDHEYGGLGIIHPDDFRAIVAHRLAPDQRAIIADMWRPTYE